MLCLKTTIPISYIKFDTSSIHLYQIRLNLWGLSTYSEATKAYCTIPEFWRSRDHFHGNQKVEKIMLSHMHHPAKLFPDWTKLWILNVFFCVWFLGHNNEKPGLKCTELISRFYIFLSVSNYACITYEKSLYGEIWLQRVCDQTWHVSLGTPEFSKGS